MRDGGERLLVAVPLRSEYIDTPAKIEERLKSLSSPILGSIKVLRGELRYIDSLGRECFADVVVQPLPSGERFGRECTYPATEQHRLLDELWQEMERVGVTHGNLRPENLIVGDDGHLHPLRYYYARFGEGCKDDFSLLHDMVVPDDVRVPEPDYRSLVGVSGPFESYTPQDGIMRVLADERYFFVDVYSGERLPGEYLWATDFYEGRAIVETEEGVGVITADGSYLIPNTYHDIEFDNCLGIFFARFGDSVQRYDYCGRPIE